MKKQKQVRKKCLSPGCESGARRRGLCDTCYTAARGLVYTEGASWAELESLGVCLPAVEHKLSKFILNLREVRRQKTETQ